MSFVLQSQTKVLDKLDFDPDGDKGITKLFEFIMRDECASKFNSRLGSPDVETFPRIQNCGVT